MRYLLLPLPFLVLLDLLQVISLFGLLVQFFFCFLHFSPLPFLHSCLFNVTLILQRLNLSAAGSTFLLGALFLPLCDNFFPCMEAG